MRKGLIYIDARLAGARALELEWAARSYAHTKYCPVARCVVGTGRGTFSCALTQAEMLNCTTVVVPDTPHLCDQFEAVLSRFDLLLVHQDIALERVRRIFAVGAGMR